VTSGWRPIVIGGVYWIDDKALSLPPDDGRVPHPRRMVLLVSGPLTNADPGWPVVMAVPISSERRRNTRFCVALGAGEGNIPKKSWVRVHLTAESP
jgi:hypothetical protein